MPTRTICPKCSAPLPSNAPEGECAGCLVQLALNASQASRANQGSFSPPDPRVLTALFDDLEVLSLIGSGGMGAVYLARQTKLHRLVALKVLSPKHASDPVFEERFLREARTLARLKHSHIVAIFDVGKTDDFWYIVMEYVDGASLRSLIRDGGLSAAEALRLIPQICDAMQYAHDNGVVHRDIKPENVLVDQQGQVKIADFGLAKLIGQPDEEVTLTDVGLRMGTVGYMAPEQATNTTEVDHRADIYALGIIFYEMLTGRRPTPNYTPPSRVIEVDSRVDRVVARSLKESPDERFQQAAEVKLAVEKIATSQRRLVPALALVAVLATAALGFALPKFANFSVGTSQRDPNASVSSAASPPGLRAPFDTDVATAQQQDWASKTGKPLSFSNSVGLGLQLIPPGEFEYSKNHHVRVTKPFYLGASEVTVAAFRKFVEATGYQTEAETSGKGGWIHSPSNYPEIEIHPEYHWKHERFNSDEQLPVVMVTAKDAEEFLAWLSKHESRTYRLPTAAEWYWACYAGDLQRLKLNDIAIADTVAWHGGNSDTKAHRVMQKTANPWGLFDTLGNVTEFSADGPNGILPVGVIEDPFLQPADNRRLGCGGSFADPYTAFEFNLNSDMPFYSIGFRVLCEVP